MSERDVLKEKWERRVTQQQSSGLSAAKWCREQEVQYKSFLYWKDRLSPVPKLTRSLTGSPACEVEIAYKDVKVALSGRIGPSNLDESVLAEIIARKFGSHIPLYRIAEEMGRCGDQPQTPLQVGSPLRTCSQTSL